MTWFGARAWAGLVALRRERLARFDDRTLVVVVVCLADALGSVNGLTQSWDQDGRQSALLVAGGLLTSGAVALGVWRGRLRSAEKGLCLVLLVVAATTQALATPVAADRWLSVYGLAGVPLVALMLTDRRVAAAVTAAAVVAQSVILASTDPGTRQLVTSVWSSWSACPSSWAGRRCSCTARRPCAALLSTWPSTTT